MLVDAAGLVSRLGAGEPVTLLDVRWRLGGPSTLADYEAGHLPGAVWVDLDVDLAGAPGAGVRHPLPSRNAFGAAMRRAGVSVGRPVVCYDQRDSTVAARAWWLLTYFGHPSTAVLDGGLDAWVAAGGALARERPLPSPADFEPRPGHLPVIDAAGAAALAREGLLLDARASERYRGEIEPIDPVAGHIPGAVSAPTAGNVGADGRFLQAEVLAARFRTLGASGPVGAYCGSGVTAAHEVLALQLAGIEASLYPGSWSEWVADPARPVAVGPEPG